jgi:uncharacterized protein (TIGR03083 family)
MDHHQQCDALEAEVANFATLLDTAAMDSPVPSCPEWTVSDLATHLGTVHRWAQRLVHERAQRYQSSDDMGFDTSRADGEWIRSGGAQLVETLRSGDPDTPMWAWGADQHLGFWSRRQRCETLMHRVDLELAKGLSPGADPAAAADAVDELLVNLKAAQVFSPNVAELHGNGQVLTFTTTDITATWSITLHPGGFVVGAGSDAADATLEGPAFDLLLVLYRRRAAGEPSLHRSGDHDLIDFWIAHSALE